MGKQTILVPDIGSDNADVIEVLVKAGDTVALDQSIVVLESAKASMEIPCTLEGVVVSVAVSVGSSVKEGDVLLEVEVAAAGDSSSVSSPSNDALPVSSIKEALQDVSTVLSPPNATVNSPVASAASSQASTSQGGTSQSSISQNKISQANASQAAANAGSASSSSATPVTANEKNTLAIPAAQAERMASDVHAGPAVRRLARELGVHLGQVKGSGPRERILKEDVHAFVKQQLTTPAPVVSATAPSALPVIDFSKWGEVERVALTKIQKVSAQNLHRAWITIPHVTQFDEADITELEAFRNAQKDALKKEGLSLTVLGFLVKACAHVLKQYPKFASSLDTDGENMVQKKYIHIGVAVDTPNGLVVPVIRDADKKSIRDIVKDLGELSAKARDKKLTPAEMQGAVFSISSLGGIGGTAFTPIVNWPEVAILGVSRSATKPVWDGSSFQPRLMLPLSLSYDHRVIDGADAARFTTALAKVLGDIRQLLL